MKVFWVKTTILGMLVFILVSLVIIKVVESIQQDWVVIEEKYFPERKGLNPVGIRSGEILDVSKRNPSCAMKFDNGRTFSVDCDEYLDFTVGEKVKIVSIENNKVKLRRK
ncbi:hypothetical protein LCL96_06325 [Rossellomorea aquimaris]|uniref:hypothetical protein n=1 Tax=Rossellomorea aquimaris TaxID=189382 RepID=UPI001CD7AF99|nr:hypothetical protein [Rossellomorea aquimaris]MCA1058542.1 hypothetical protein [Rossellomorea aquimaris]